MGIMELAAQALTEIESMTAAAAVERIDDESLQLTTQLWLDVVADLLG